MPPVYPSIYISCPCSDQSSLPNPTSRGGVGGHLKKPSESYDPDFDPSDDDDDSPPFDPRNPRSAFSLFPLEHLLYCEDCHQIRCPRCVQEEIVSYFCPSCLFEVPSSTVKTEGNRCTRNCFQCPICFASVSVMSSSDIGSGASAATTTLGPSGEQVTAPTGPYSLTCSYCHWSSKEIGLEFDKPANLTAQFAKQLKAAATENPKPKYAEFSTYEENFAKLKLHYTSQGIGAAGSAGGAAGGGGLGVGRGGTDDYGHSPGTLSRLMGLYTGGGHVGKRNISGLSARGKDASGKKMELTEMVDVEIVGDEKEIIDRLIQVEFDETTTQAQYLCQPHQPKFKSQLRPIATLLRTKRSKRCRACRHILVKPEPKVQSIRFRIKLVAMNYIPAINISRLDPTTSYHSLTPLSTHQFLLTVTNPLFDPISVSLSTPQKTPGKYPSIVTILCPEFEVGANTDAWDEVLKEDSTGEKKSRRVRGDRDRSGGTVWDSGRNWSTVVIEVIPPNTEGRNGNAGRWAGPSSGLRGGTPPPQRSGSPFGTPNMGAWALGRSQTSPGFLLGAGIGGAPGAVDEDEEEERDEEEEKVVQVPIFVRIEYEAEVGMESGDVGDVAGGDGRKEKKEHAYWCVLYLGKIGSGGPAAGMVGSGTGTSGAGAPAGGMGVLGIGLRDAGGSGGLGVGGVMGRVATGISGSKGSASAR
ncbi:dynactin p62 family-domain-containing protein [Tirmania nivea]|nr:dynactin p62 family-domain-containing protein [Tirmania nivea]